MSRKLKVAVVGVGHFGRNHARIYASMPGVELVAVADPREDRARAIGEQYHARPVASHTEVGEVEERQPLVVAVREHERQDRDLRLVQVEDLAEEQRSERGDGGSDRRAERSREREELGRVRPRLERDVELIRTLDDPLVGRVARL